VTHHAALFNVVNYLASLVSSNTPELIAVGAAVLVYVQHQINKLPWLQHDIDEVQMLRRQLVAVGLPVITMVGASLATNKDFVAFAAPLYGASQVIYTLWRRIMAQAKVQQSAAPNPSLATDNAPAAG
jgi:hypothetical protein